MVLSAGGVAGTDGGTSWGSGGTLHRGHLGRATGAKVGIIIWEVLEHSAAGMPQQAG